MTPGFDKEDVRLIVQALRVAYALGKDSPYRGEGKNTPEEVEDQRLRADLIATLEALPGHTAEEHEYSLRIDRLAEKEDEDALRRDIEDWGRRLPSRLKHEAVRMGAILHFLFDGSATSDPP